MTVKDLVQLYDSSPSTSRVNSPRRESREDGQQPGDIRAGGGDIRDEIPPPRPARFIKKPEKVSSPPLSRPSSRPPPSSRTSTTLTTSSRAEDPITKVNIPPETASPHWSRLHNSPPRRPKYPGRAFDTDESVPLVQLPYPPSNPWSSENGIHLKSPASYSHYERHDSQHKPIPATVLFARNAYPLSLPKLDDHLASLVIPFVVSKKEDGGGGEMFPPLDQLAKTGMSLDDLEHNSQTTPSWRNRASILSTIQNLLIGLLGSSALASFYSLQGLISTLQIFALILSTIVPSGNIGLKDTWRQVFLGTIPNVLALNFAPVVLQSLIFLAVCLVIGAGMLYYFYRSTTYCDRYNSVEGLQQVETKGNQVGLLIVTFLLVVIYLPLSTMSVHVLVWSEELWATPNPYKNATSFPPHVPPLGPSNQFRDPLDFCWTTTMKRNEVNLAPIFVVLSAVVFLLFSIWFPVALRQVIRQSVPKVDTFTELGRRRTNVEMDSEYHRLLERDHNPFAFLYNSFRRGWGTYISVFLSAKLSTLLIVAIVDADNCVFRNFDRIKVSIARQTLLVVSTLGFFIAQSTFAPFIEPVNNASEWTSRLNYLSTSLTSLVIILDVPAKQIFDSYILYSIYIITYGLGFYFTVANTGWMQRIIKILTRRIDFSVDIFSPRLDISATSIHTKRRIWQESISALLLTHPECRIPAEQAMAYAQARDSEYPPYLLDFKGTPGERHVENLKILRDVGSLFYNRTVALSNGPDSEWYRYLEDVIQKNYVGPDSFWKKPGQDAIPGCSNYFGNAWWIPFPPTLVVRYDEGPYAVLRTANELEEYINQNSSEDTQRRRFVRMSIRALEGRIVHWPYEHVEPVGSHIPLCCGRRYEAVTSRHYQRAVLKIKRRGHLVWQGLQLGSGFEIELRYSKKVTVSGEVIGLNEDFDLTSSLARFLEYNHDLIDKGLYDIQTKLSHYRWSHRKECKAKSRVLTYRFMSYVYDQPRGSEECKQESIEHEHDERVRDCIKERGGEVFSAAYERLMAVSKSEATTWWYIFWDDLWRRNHDTISGLRKHEADFNPHFKSSIAYMPLPRPALESFLMQRGLLHKKTKGTDFFHAGFLNKLYLRLNDAVFRHTRRAIMFHLGNDKRELDMEELDILTQGGTSTLGTGGGTDHDASGILIRPNYRWEGLLNDPPRKGGHHAHGPSGKRWLAKLGVWFGITPFWRSGAPSNGISVDVRLEKGRYVLIEDEGWSVSGRETGVGSDTNRSRTTLVSPTSPSKAAGGPSKGTDTNRSRTATLVAPPSPTSKAGGAGSSSRR